MLLGRAVSHGCGSAPSYVTPRWRDLVYALNGLAVQGSSVKVVYEHTSSSFYLFLTVSKSYSALLTLRISTNPNHQAVTTMDFVKNAMGGNGGENQQSGSGQQPGSGGFLGGLGDKLNGAAGGGRESEKNEDYLDKGIDMVQEKVLGQGPQDNESAVEQAKDVCRRDFA